MSRVHEAYAGELLDVRNVWAHMKSFTDDAYRAFDTAKRLATAIDSAEVATGSDDPTELAAGHHRQG